MSTKVAFLTTIFPMPSVYLEDFFNSLQNQTFSLFDVVVVNDGYCSFGEVVSKYPTLSIIELPYENTIAKNREHGINYVIENNYDILIFGDSDDYFHTNRVEKSIELLLNYDIAINDVSLCNDTSIYEDKYISNRVQNGTIIDRSFIENKNILGFSNTCVNVKVLEILNINRDLLYVDWFFYKKLLSENKTAIFTNETITYYRQYQNQTLGLKNDNNKFLLWHET